jgi:hypothetical protein
MKMTNICLFSELRCADSKQAEQKLCLHFQKKVGQCFLFSVPHWAMFRVMLCDFKISFYVNSYVDKLFEK